MPDTDTQFMQQALSLARTNLGQTWPNPSVGAVVVKNNSIIGQGCTARGGRPHAETEALAQAGSNAQGATLYVTLEPCSHHGKTPPCVDAIISAGIARCVIACRDPHKQVNGAGIAALQSAGIEIIENVCREEARLLNRGFISVVEKGRPYIALKIATSADRKIAYPPLPTPLPCTGEGSCEQSSQRERAIRWITSEPARNEVHRLRSEFDAVLTGIGTVLADDPLLTVRLQGLEHKSPVRVVLDRNLRTPPDSQLIKTAKDVPVWIMSPSYRRRPVSTPQHDLELSGAKILSFPDYQNVDSGLRRNDELEKVVSLLASQGITRLLVEAGQGLNTAFINSGLVDLIYWFKAPFEIGAGGLDAFSNIKTLPEAWTKHPNRLSFPPDNLEIYERMDSGLRRNDK